MLATTTPDPLLIGLVGPKGSGKTRAAAYLIDEYAFIDYALADPLRDMLSALLTSVGVDYAVLTEPHLKEAPLPQLGGITPRRLMQSLGTDWARQLLGPDIWLLVADHALGLAPDSSITAPVHDRIVIDDVRFHNEADWIRRRGGVIVRIDRGIPTDRSHVSESQQLLIDADHVVDNTGNTDHLERRLDLVMRSLLQRAAA